MNSDEAACRAGYVLLTPASFHNTEQELISWECPTCGAVVARHSWQKHDKYHYPYRDERQWVHATGQVPSNGR